MVTATEALQATKHETTTMTRRGSEPEYPNHDDTWKGRNGTNHQSSEQTHHSYGERNGVCIMQDRRGISDNNEVNIERKYANRGNSEPSRRMRELLEGINSNGDSGNPVSPPPWLDRVLFNRGKRFYHRYLFCIFFSDLLALLMMFSVSRILRPLIYTGRSDTPHRAMRRYVSTIKHVIQWYSGDVWNTQDEAHRDILRVRSVHTNSYRMFNCPKHHSQVDEVTVKVKGHQEPKCPLHPNMRRDLGSQICPGIEIEHSDSPTTYISQWDMVFTQYSFMGLIVKHPHKVGAWWVSEDELEGLIHFWRGIGWLLGIEDRYNFCNGSVDETKALCYEMEHHVIKPGMAAGDWSYEHMCSSLVQGMNKVIPGLSYPAMFRFMTDILGLNVPSWIDRMNNVNRFQYWLLRFIFHVLFLVPGVIFVFNEMLKVAISAVNEQIPKDGRDGSRSQQYREPRRHIATPNQRNNK